MKSYQLIRFWILLMILGVSFFATQAQQKGSFQSNPSSYPYVTPSFYVGVEGGYLFKNNGLSENPAYYLDQGYFGELNLGWRSKNNGLGWQLDAGRLNIERKLPYEKGAAFGLNGYETLQSAVPDNWMWQNAPQDDRVFLFDTATMSAFTKTNLGSWYAMTGPKFWFGQDRLQGFLGLEAGAGMTTFGYYFLMGRGNSSNTLQYDYYSKPNSAVIGAADVQLRQSFYMQYGATQKTIAGYTPPGNVKDKAEINFMARGTAGLAYFITPRISVNATASYWYLMVPEWKSHIMAGGLTGGNVKPTAKPGTPDPYVDFTNNEIVKLAYNYQKDFDKKNLGLINASIGVKFWIGRKTKTKPVVKEEQPAPVIPQMQTKNLLVTVKDKPTGFALSSVKVTVYKEGKPFYTGMTDANGAVPAIKDLKPGNYKIQGELNGIKTTVAHVNSSDFEGAARVISRELLHNDLRFTLVGHTLNAQTETKIPHVKTTLNQDKGGANSFQMSDEEGEFRFQLKPNADFTVYAEQKGYFSNREKVSTKGLDRSKTLYVDLRLSMNELKEGAHFELKNIYYDFDRYNIRPDAAKVLNDVYRMLAKNSTVSIELSSYTDSRGSDSYNMKLSQERANAAVRYLVNKGIDPSRLVAKGYGETRPVNGCVNGVPCTDEQHQANRRTEIKVLKN